MVVPYAVTANMAIRRSDFKAVNGFDETLTRCEDIAISWQRLAGGRTIGYCADALVDYRVRRSVRGMLHQQYLYGIGMAEVLARIERPGQGPTRAIDMLRPNNQRGGLGSPIAVLRKAAIGAGRLDDWFQGMSVVVGEE